MGDITVPVPDERVPEFYEMFGRWLAGHDPADAAGSTVLRAWQNTPDDLALARVVWDKLSDRAKAMFGVLIDSPEKQLSGEQIANDLAIPNGKYGVAGVLAWPGRHCAAVGRALPVKYEDGAVGESANYWMSADNAALFAKARDGQ